MKNIKHYFIIILILQAFLCPPCSAQDAVKKIIDNGDDTARFVFVVIAEGYTAVEIQKFDNDCQNIITTFFSSTPWHEYQSLINVYSIFTASNQSGADIPSEDIYVDTAFDATFDSYGISQLLTVNDAKVLNTAAQVPTFDAVFVLVNDPHYGGSSGSTIVLSTNSAAGEIALHEAGHLIGNLADEYNTPYSVYTEETEKPNITVETEREKIPWNLWLDADIPLPTPETITDKIGLFEGADYNPSEIYRPKHDCKMRELGVPYCEICTEAIIRSIYQKVHPIDSFSPEESEITVKDQAITLWVQPVEVSDSVFKAVWELDGTILDNQSQMTCRLEPTLLSTGTHTMRVRIRNATDKVRTDSEGLLTDGHSWVIHKIDCSGNVSGRAVDADTKAFIESASIKLLQSSETVSTDTTGQFKFNNLPCGMYTAVVTASGYAETTINFSIADNTETVLNIDAISKSSLHSVSGNIVGRRRESITVKLHGRLSAKVQTSADGNFIFPSLPPGNYSVIPEAPGVRFLPASQTVTVEETNLQDITFLSYKSPSPPITIY